MNEYAYFLDLTTSTGRCPILATSDTTLPMVTSSSQPITMRAQCNQRSFFNFRYRKDLINNSAHCCQVRWVLP